jgi:hypothetical protein
VKNAGNGNVLYEKEITYLDYDNQKMMSKEIGDKYKDSYKHEYVKMK